ncbi:NAAT family transporter [Ectothiorhodospiraceae bacterium WFHF3C12]|nr:NAAT family transporter [Ectothiorhodospiraceae bacterium WFHF3C12]
MDTVTAAITLFLIMDPIGNIPVFLSVLKDVPDQRRRRVLARELVLAYLVLLAFLLVGPFFLDLLQLTPEAISIASGIILFIIALRMIFPSRGGVMGENIDGEPFFVPLAVPLIAGPSTMAILLLLVQQHPDRLADWFVAMTGAWIASSAILMASGLAYRFLRRRGLIALERLMGMLLVALAVQMLLDGLEKVL